jgi:hypothetical protein
LSSLRKGGQFVIKYLLLLITFTVPFWSHHTIKERDKEQKKAQANRKRKTKEKTQKASRHETQTTRPTDKQELHFFVVFVLVCFIFLCFVVVFLFAPPPPLPPHSPPPPQVISCFLDFKERTLKNVCVNERFKMTTQLEVKN